MKINGSTGLCCLAALYFFIMAAPEGISADGEPAAATAESTQAKPAEANADAGSAAANTEVNTGGTAKTTGTEAGNAADGAKNIDYNKLYTTEQPKPEIVVKMPEIDYAKEAEKLNTQKIKIARTKEKIFLASGGFFGFLNWLLLLINIFITCYVIGNVSRHIGKNRVLPKSLIDEVRDFLTRGELGFALEACKNSQAPLARILHEAFKNISDGFEAGQDAMKIAINTEKIKLWKPVQTLIPCGIIAAALGFTGMAFVLEKQLKEYSISNSIAAEKVLAYTAAQSLYPLIVGILGACVAFLLYFYCTRKIARITVNTELLSYDIIRVLRGAEVVEDEFPEMATMTQLINSSDYR